jgi:eukaryotic-like serine/threonine-protein kinase
MALSHAKGFAAGEGMPESSSKLTRYRFGPFDLDPGEGTLARHGIRVRLQDLPYRLLVMLVERSGEVVTREELRQHLWPQNTFVEFDNSLGVAIRKVRESLNDNADAPQYVETIPRRGYRFVAPVTMEARSEPVEIGLPPQLPDPIPVPIPPNRPPIAAKPAFDQRKSYWLAAGFASLLVVAGLLFRFYPKPHDVSPTPQVSAATPVRLRRSVAVLGFRNLPGRHEDDWLSPVFSEMLDTELGTRGDLRMVSAEDVARVKHDLPPTGEGSLAKGTLERLRENPGADVVVLGSYTPLPGKDETRIRLDLRVQDTADGETIAEEAITGDRNDLFALAAQAGARLRHRLGLTANSLGDANQARVALPSDERSARLYVGGRAKLWAFDFLGARDLLLKAVAADSEFPLAHSALSEAWWHLGYQTKARAEAQRARELSQDLPEEDRFLIEGQYWRAMGDSAKTVQAYRTLFQLFPDSLDYGLLLATAQIGFQPAAALQTLATLRRLPSPAGADARIDMTEASAWIGQDLVKARAAAKSAIEKGRIQGRPVLVARTYGFLCEQGVGLGVSMDEAAGDCVLARKSAEAAEDRNAAAMMSTDLAALYYQQGEVARSGEMFRAAIKEFQEVGNLDGVGAAMSNLGSALLTSGNLNEARKLLQDSVPNYQAVEDKEGVALSLNTLGDLSRQNGKLQVAETTYQQAMATAQEAGDKSAVAYVLCSLGDVLVDQGKLAAARASYEKSLALRNQVGEKQLALETQVGLAQLSIEEGHAAEVEKPLRQWKQQFHQERQADDELAASTALTRAMLAQGKQAEARTEIESSQDLAAKSQNLLVRLEYELEFARVLLALGHPDTAKPRLEHVAREARAHELQGVELEAMAAAAELEFRSGRKATAQQQLASLEHMARDKGFGLIARKAAAAAAQA